MMFMSSSDQLLLPLHLLLLFFSCQWPRPGRTVWWEKCATSGNIWSLMKYWLWRMETPWKPARVMERTVRTVEPLTQTQTHAAWFMARNHTTVRGWIRDKKPSVPNIWRTPPANRGVSAVCWNRTNSIHQCLRLLHLLQLPRNEILRTWFSNIQCKGARYNYTLDSVRSTGKFSTPSKKKLFLFQLIPVFFPSKQIIAITMPLLFNI